MKIWTSPYRLIGSTTLNSQTAQNYIDGVLLRVEGNEGLGYTCLQCWSPLGEVPLEVELQALRENRPSEKVRWLLQMAEQEALWRSEGTSIWEKPLLSLVNHHLCLSLKDLESLLRNPRPGQGDLPFIIKLKMNRDWPQLFSLLQTVSLADFKASIEGRDLYWRLDFNNALTPQEYMSFCRQWEQTPFGKIDFIEDPFPYDAKLWVEVGKATGISLAWDLRVSCGGGSHQDKKDLLSWKNFEYQGVDVLVIKPLAVAQKWWPDQELLGPRRLAFTSNMDHPLGQLQGLWNARDYYLSSGIKPEVCGFASHSVWQRNAYSEQLRINGDVILGAAGAGLGFGDLLEKEEWQELC